MLKAIAAPRVVIDWRTPSVDHGRWPAKAALGQPLTIEVTICCDGHDVLDARAIFQSSSDGGSHLHSELEFRGQNIWTTTFYPAQAGWHRLIVEAWVDEWATFCKGLSAKRAAGQDVGQDVMEGMQMLQELAKAASPTHRKYANVVMRLRRELETLSTATACERLLSRLTADLVQALNVRHFLARISQPIEVEREAAAFASWYELFPRSAANNSSIHGTFDDVIARLPAIHAMGFDVLYFPPIHPIGSSHRKGRNNSLRAEPGEPGSPYAIGNNDGGHTAVHPELGGLEAFQRLRRAARKLGIELALDFAIQCSPDHPWIRQHPGWFRWRPDGTIHYAENPPKKYEDIVPVDFYAQAAKPDLWLALRDVVLFWVEQGVRIFRVDNPHTKPLPFWRWLITTVRESHPDVIFLSEAFTYPMMMYQLAKIGFSQSYTYFIWRNNQRELKEYLTELSREAPRDFFRPHFFVNTPDINPYFLQASGRPGFVIRAALAATLSGLWGIYSGFELCEAEPLPGKEEYWHSEKYEIKHRDWNTPGNIVNVIAQLNRIRRANPALHTHLGIEFHDSGNDQVLYFSKVAGPVNNRLLIAISLDPHRPQEAYLPFPAQALNLEPGVDVEVEELMRGQRFHWHDEHHHWYFNPHDLPLAIWRISPTGSEATNTGAH
ncbi:MAG TPA: maltotransferase domain-containing protein [Dongiaceae bacterium]|nr:maltotransferase domain-containing protein [Dongiaceae bacterium]